MKIVSDFSDYYDFIGKLNYFEDDNLTYTRPATINISNLKLYNTFDLPYIPTYAHLGKKYYLKKIAFKVHRLIIGKYILNYLEQIYLKTDQRFFKILTKDIVKIDRDLPDPLVQYTNKNNYTLLKKIGQPIISLPSKRYRDKLVTLEIPNLSHIQGIHNVLNPYDAYKEVKSFLEEIEMDKLIKRDRTKRFV